MLYPLTLVLGGASSGKSAFAENIVKLSGYDKVYLATARVWDVEIRTKVVRHREDRGPDWTTIEEPLDLEPILHNAAPDQVILLDCATMWLSNHLLAENDLAAAETDLLAAISHCKAPIVVVSNELGQSGVPDNALARQFRDAQGKLNQRLAAQADLVVAVMAGLPMVLKGTLP